MFPGFWWIPWGRSEEWETSEQTVVREVAEETGLHFIPTKLFQTAIIEHSGQERKTYRYLGEFSGKLDIQEEEADGYAWFTYDEVQELQLAFDHMDTIRLLHENNFL